MKVHSGFSEWQLSVRTAVSLGNFDGVHIGHQTILRKTRELAQSSGLPAVAVTFDPVPKKILQPGTAPPLIQTLHQRLASLEDIGMDHTIVVPFSDEFARKTPQQFVFEFLINKLNVKFFVVGENFAFGHQKQGDLSLLKKLGSAHDFEVEGVPEVFLGEIRVSSSQIRDFILKGKMEEAARFLGTPFALAGRVVEGEHLGGKLGIPTANLHYENEIVPAKGVYVCRAKVRDQEYCAATNIGIRPTFHGKTLTVEAHLLDFDGDLYGSEMELQFYRKLRDEMQFSSVEQLKMQIRADIEQTRNDWSCQRSSGRAC